MMISWFLMAIFGHLSNAVAFVIDKTLLNSAFKKSATYAALIGSVSLLVLVAVPWIRVWPSFALYPAIIGFGALFVFALLAFFEALRKAEASRVVPIVGSFIPIFTVIGELVLFQMHPTVRVWIGFALLLLATWILTSRTQKGRKSPVSFSIVALAILASLLFASASLCGKYAFDRGEWLSVFVLSRVAAGVVGLFIGFAFAGSRQELLQILHPKKTGTRRSLPALLALVGQVFGAIGFALVNISIAEGTPSVVNALQAVQYAAIILVAWLGGSALRRALHEDVTRRTILIKSIAIGFVAIGLALLSS